MNEADTPDSEASPRNRSAAVRIGEGVAFINGEAFVEPAGEERCRGTFSEGQRDLFSARPAA